ncbi:MAG TPA: GTP cyclohydrolase I FolE [Gammaproteobacteria bacterium]|nr:GTP cyclohydrolase I FolE [Gammaproteobacteria bacterium]
MSVDIAGDIKLSKLEESFHSLLTQSGDDPSREGVLDTPKRASKAFSFLTSGYHQNLEKIVGKAVFPCVNDGMVVVKDIEFYSLCEHHILPFFGSVSVGYLPKDKVIGLSKIPRIVDMYARRLQIQEQLGLQIAQAINLVIDTHGVAVVVKAQHMCMSMRGVQKQGTCMTSSTMLGGFRDNLATRQEFLGLV